RPEAMHRLGPLRARGWWLLKLRASARESAIERLQKQTSSARKRPEKEGSNSVLSARAPRLRYTNICVRRTGFLRHAPFQAPIATGVQAGRRYPGAPNTPMAQSSPERNS